MNPFALKNISKKKDQLIVNQPVIGHQVGSIQAGWLPFHIRAMASRLLHHQYSGSDVPRIQMELPEAVQATRRDIGEVESSCSRPADSMGKHRQLVVKMNVEVKVPAAAWKPGCHQRMLQPGSLRNA